MPIDPYRLNPQNYDRELFPEDVFLRWFNDFDVMWLHDGDSSKPHAELTSGMCSNGFFDCMRILKYPNLCEALAKQLAIKLRKQLMECADVPGFWVIGSPYAGITFSFEVAKALRARHGFAEKDPSDPKGKKMLWRRETIQPGDLILQVEDLITTAGTLNEVRQAILTGNPGLDTSFLFFEFVGTLVHRPPKLPIQYEGFKVVSLIEREVWAVPPDQCPLCKAGSVRLRPKTHWLQLTGKA